MRPEVIVIGAAIADIPLSPVGPEVFANHSTEVQSIRMQVGVDAANEALTLARLGHAPALVSVVGRDALGDFVLRTLEDGGVDTSGVCRSEEMDTGVNVVLVREGGERTFVTSRAGSLRRLALPHILPAL